MSGGLPHPEDKTDKPPEMAELRLQAMSKTVMYCRLNNLFLFYFICQTIITKNKGKERKKEVARRPNRNYRSL